MCNGIFDIVLGGAPKSDTSSLFDALSEHLRINASQPKEPRFFMDDRKSSLVKNGEPDMEAMSAIRTYYATNSADNIS